MTSIFDTLVNNRRKHTPFARVNFMAFVSEMLWNSTDDEAAFVDLKCSYNKRSSTSRTWSLMWKSCDGQDKHVSSEKFDLLMWRAAEVEMSARSEVEKDSK